LTLKSSVAQCASKSNREIAVVNCNPNIMPRFVFLSFVVNSFTWIWREWIHINLERWIL